MSGHSNHVMSEISRSREEQHDRSGRKRGLWWPGPKSRLVRAWMERGVNVASAWLISRGTHDPHQESRRLVKTPSIATRSNFFTVFAAETSVHSRAVSAVV